MNTDVWKILISYTNTLENVINNIIITPFLNWKWYTLLRDSMTTIQGHLAHLWLSKSPVQVNLSFNLLNYRIPKIYIAVCRLGSSKPNRKSSIVGSIFWSSIPKRCVHTNINKWVKKALSNLIGYRRVWRTMCSEWLDWI